MNGKSVSVCLLLLVTICSGGSHLLTAQEAVIRGARATPKQIRDSQPESVKLTATVARTIGRSIQDLRDLAEDMEKSGQRAEVTRLRNAIKEMVRRAEQELMDKRAQVVRLNEEIEDLKMGIGQ